MLALKEWAIAVEALASGDQMIAIRKGGIHEETKQFDLKSNAFVLFPAYEHQKETLVRHKHTSRVTELRLAGCPNPLEIGVYAEVTQEWLLEDESKLKQLEQYHIWTEQFAQIRLHWKKEQPLHILALRVYLLEEVFELSDPLQYTGCKSWFELPFDVDAGKSKLKPVLDDQDYEKRIKLINHILG